MTGILDIIECALAKAGLDVADVSDTSILFCDDQDNHFRLTIEVEAG